MSIISEITNLLKLLALQLKDRKSNGDVRISGNLDASTGDETSLQYASLINSSLNFTGRSELLDAALSILCHQASDVYSSTTKYLVDTLVAVLASSISCRVLSLRPHYRLKSSEPIIELQDLLKNGAGVCCASEKSCFPTEEILQIGSFISADDCTKLAKLCLDILFNLDHHGEFSHLLSHSFLKVATSVSSYKVQFPSSMFIYERLQSEQIASVFTSGSLKEQYSLQWRQLVWYLDPLSLKEDISSILRDAMKRPFLCLRTALREKVEWHSVMLSLVTSPAMFIETRSLLHSWFLLTGLNSIILLRIQLVSSLLDMLSRPTLWGLPMELGLILPFPHAFFPERQRQVLELLSGSISCRHFQVVVQLMEQDSRASQCLDSHGTASPMKESAMTMDHSSTWATLLDFPAWFYFAVMLLFRWKQCEDKFGPLKCDANGNRSEQYFSDLRCAAARYLGWMLSPTDSSYWNMMVQSLNEASASWMECHKVDPHLLHVCTGSRHTSLERKNVEKVMMASTSKNDTMSVRSWLKEFQNQCVDCYNKAGFSGSSSGHTELHVLIRKIPLGIFIGNIRTLDSSECEVLLHYVCSGQILVPEEMNAAEKNMTGRPKDHEHVQRKYSWEKIKGTHVDWIQGTVFMFDLFNILEDLVADVLESEDGLDFICEAKAKSVRYLTNCIGKLFQANDLPEIEMLIDLQCRFLRWMQQGRELFDGYDECNELALVLGCKISCMQGN